MAIVRIDPANWQDVSIVQIDSDAQDNRRAIDEIESWACDHGFVRHGEHWLRLLIRDGRQLFRGICYRVTEEDRRGFDEVGRKVAEAAQRAVIGRT